MSSTPQANIDSVLTENRVFECSEEFRSKAHVKSMAEYERLYREAETDPDKFWETLPANCTGSRSGTRCGSGIVRGPSGFRAVHSISPTTAWTGTWRRGGGTRRR